MINEEHNISKILMCLVLFLVFTWLVTSVSAIEEVPLGVSKFNKTTRFIPLVHNINLILNKGLNIQRICHRLYHEHNKKMLCASDN